jgi:hypothetical protein
MNQAKKSSTKPKRSSVRHTRAIQRDRQCRPVVAPPDAEIEARLTELLTPGIEAQLPWYRARGLRVRLLGLSVMVAIVISLIWRQLGAGGTEIARLLHSEGLLWVGLLTVSQQAVSDRLCAFPARLFLGVLRNLLVQLHARWLGRSVRLSPELTWAQQHYSAVLSADGSTLDALLRQVGLLREEATWPLAGKLLALLDVCSWLPWALWFDADAQVHDQRFWPRLACVLPPDALLLIDLGFTNFTYFAALTCTYITRAKSNLAFQLDRTLRCDAQVHDRRVWIGAGTTRQLVRLVMVQYAGRWYRYLTNELDPRQLPPAYVAALYQQRWRIEDAFNIVKRLLGLAYFWNGAQEGVLLQLWATWMVYGILVDLTDAVAEVLQRPLMHLSLEMVYRSLYYFGQAQQRGEAEDPVAYLAANAEWLGIIKQRWKTTPTAAPPLTNSADP